MAQRTFGLALKKPKLRSLIGQTVGNTFTFRPTPTLHSQPFNVAHMPHLAEDHVHQHDVLLGYRTSHLRKPKFLEPPATAYYITYQCVATGHHCLFLLTACLLTDLTLRVLTACLPLTVTCLVPLPQKVSLSSVHLCYARCVLVRIMDSNVGMNNSERPQEIFSIIRGH